MQVEPDDGFYIDSLGWVYYQRGEYPEAVEYLERAVELVNDDPTITEHLGDAYEKVGRIGDASRTYRAALDQATESDQHRRLRDKIDSLVQPGQETRFLRARIKIEYTCLQPHEHVDTFTLSGGLSAWPSQPDLSA